jgi:hypothetical protein
MIMTLDGSCTLNNRGIKRLNRLNRHRIGMIGWFVHSEQLRGRKRLNRHRISMMILMQHAILLMCIVLIRICIVIQYGYKKLGSYQFL